MLLRGITQGHPFEDGNKRTGFLVASFYLNLMGIPLPLSFDADRVVALCLDVSAGKVRDVAVIASSLRFIWGATSW